MTFSGCCSETDLCRVFVGCFYWLATPFEFIDHRRHETHNESKDLMEAVKRLVNICCSVNTELKICASSSGPVRTKNHLTCERLIDDNVSVHCSSKHQDLN